MDIFYALKVFAPVNQFEKLAVVSVSNVWIKWFLVSIYLSLISAIHLREVLQSTTTFSVGVMQQMLHIMQMLRLSSSKEL